MMYLVPPYFETSWSITSSIGIFCALTTASIMPIVGYSRVLAVPFVCSCMAALANGLCYYAYYATYYEFRARTIAAAFADVFWFFQEAGLSVYSFLILVGMLTGKKKICYLTLYSGFFMLAAAARLMILFFRQQGFFAPSDALQDTVNNFHVFYFLTIAVLELVNAWFLISVLRRHTGDLGHSTSVDLLQFIIGSSEVRMASLAVIGVLRSVTYSFQVTAQAASNNAGQLDRFVYTLECLFPFIMLIDNLLARITARGASRAPTGGNTSKLSIRQNQSMGP